jgi:hypothetical protein
MILGSVALFLLLAAISIVGYPPLLVMAQQPQTGTLPIPPTTTTPTLTPIPPLTPEEQEQQNRLQNVIAATNQNLDEAEKEVNGIVYTPRWSDVVWVEANSLSILFAYCLPGEFAESGQEILGGFELEVLESYEIALAQGFMVWMMVVGNEDRQDRLPAAVGVICASDLNDVETRVLSPQEQQQINNVVQQFTATQVTNIEQVINIINNVTTNATTGGPVMPPPPPTNDTGGGGGGPPTECPQGSFYNSTSGQCEYPTFDIDCPQGSFYNSTSGQCEYPTITAVDTTPPVFQHELSDQTFETDDPEGVRVSHGVFYVMDDVDGFASYTILGTRQEDDVGGSITISCNWPSDGIYPIGVTPQTCTATDSSGNAVTKSYTVTVELVSPSPTEEALVEEEQPAPTADDEEEAPVEEEQPVTEEDEAATSPPANDQGGG